MAGSEGRDPIEDFRTLRRELKLYDPRLAARPFAVVANKMDLPEAAANLRRFKAKFRKVSVIPVSAKKGEGIEKVKRFWRGAAPDLISAWNACADAEAALLLAARPLCRNSLPTSALRGTGSS